MHWVNGQPCHEFATADRGLQFGDGCFTTGHVYRGVLLDRDAHILRLQDTCQRLAIEQVDWTGLAQTLEQACWHSTSEQALKVIITRGQGGRGYSPQGCISPTVIVSLHPFPTHYREWQQEGVKLATTPIQLGASPLLAGLKHLNRLEQVLLKRSLIDTSADDLVVTDVFGHLVETTASNLFWRSGHVVYTPSLDNAGVAGLMREKIMAVIDGLPDYQCQTVSLGESALWQAEEVFISNTLMKVVPVNAINQTDYHTHTLTQVLQQRLNAC
ncbi:aminodeoxychorismate lyase [Salinivibrio sp. ES.052]|uniref:aminodeoxychorismate lyase n=1 Tax=Salinivibrio sp. ES.052 TaxID=1882823 RepID=UPI000928F630|nr:aminodeoxychorismate lyase [Salinivibrio sp. ES.052]SIN80604.1 aminodeoxychorismate lyase apoprotein [Salinivibrio sp. ES.052]